MNWTNAPLNQGFVQFLGEAMLKRCCNELERQQLKIAFVESASSGFLCSQFSIYKHSGADILLGSMVCYDPSIKLEILQLDPALIERYSAESAEVTTALAYAGQQLFAAADVIVACTGLLKPGGSATPEKPEGTFYISILFNDQCHDYHYWIAGTPKRRLEQLTEYVANSVYQLITFKKISR